MRRFSVLVVLTASFLVACGTGRPGTGLPGPGSDSGSPDGTSPVGTSAPTPAPTPAPAPSIPSSAPTNPTASGAPPTVSTNQGQTAGQGPLVVAEAQTEAEVATVRNAKMDESLGRFDELIRGEREQIARERDEQAGGDGAGDGDGDGSADGTATGDEESSGSAGEEKPGEKSPGEERSAGDMKSDKAAGGTGASTGGQGATGKDIPDGSDDDIIARQIREAAEKETDPELKEKLWKEYIEYKKNAQKK